MSANPLPEQVDSLLAAFRHHDDLRRRRASVPELAASRYNLYQAEMAAYRASSTWRR